MQIMYDTKNWNKKTRIRLSNLQLRWRYVQQLTQQESRRVQLFPNIDTRRH